MKKTILFILSVCFVCTVLSSCKKDSNNTAATYFIKFKIDGTDQSFTSVIGNSGLQDQSGTSNYITELIAFNKTATDQVTIQLNTTGSLKANTNFTSDNNAEATFNNFVGINISLNNTSLDSFQADGGQITLQVTSVNSTEVQGTFTGTLAEHSTGKTHIITNGQFDAPLSSLSSFNKQVKLKLNQ